MSSFPEEATGRPRPRPIPLGRLLVQRGLLTEQQLVEGLLEQNRTGDRLGSVLIRLGFVDAPNVAMALASQHGGPLKTEYGFATGFPGGLPEAEAEEPEPTTPATFSSELRVADAADPEPAEDEPVVESPAAEESSTATAPTEDRPASQIAAALTGLQAVQAELEAADTRIAELGQELGTAQEQVDAANARIAELEQELTAARVELDSQRSRVSELEERVAGDRLAAETALAALRGVAEAAR